MVATFTHIHSHIVIFWYIFLSFIKIYLIGAGCLIAQCVQRMKKTKDIPVKVSIPKVAIITGGANGIGYHTSRKLAMAGVHVVMGVQQMELASVALSRIRQEFPDARIEAIELDLSSFASIRKFAADFLAKDLPLDILINNAGVMFVPYRLTTDGWEEHFQVNYLGHYLLTSLLLGCLQRSGTRDSYSRIINVSSHVHYAGDFCLEKTANKCTYSCHAAYCQSKMAIVMFTHHLQRRLQEAGSHVTVNCLHPGVVDTDLYKHVNIIVKIASIPLKIFYKSPEEGALTTVFLALSPSVEAMCDCYYDNCKPVKPAKLSFNHDLQERLWSLSQDAVRVTEH